MGKVDLPVTILHRVLRAETLLGLLAPLQHLHVEHRLPGQTGVSLGHYPDPEHLLRVLAPLVDFARSKVGAGDISLRSSSFRVQGPLGDAGLAPHQDAIALNGKPGLTFWLPMTPIGHDTPTLAVGVDPGRVLEHRSSPEGYAVLADGSGTEYLAPLVGLDVGDAVVLSPTRIHATHVPLSTTRVRYSMDVRYICEGEPEPLPIRRPLSRRLQERAV